jgi:hypothetical protein
VAVGDAEVFVQPVLSDTECALATREVLNPPPALRESCWYAAPDLVTIGAPLYRNRDRMQVYAELARTTNGLLYETYRWLYDRVADLFEHRYACPASFVDELAIPGFHLMTYDGAGRAEGGGWHFDQLAQQVPYFARRPVELEGILNFTLPLAVPSGGTGMDILTDAPAEGGTPPQVHIPYQPGVIVFNECELMHRIGPSVSNSAGECRLTLQGHGVFFRSRLLLFW